MPRIKLVEGDITEEHADAIVNAANATLLGGGGVDGAIHRRGGETILEACQELRRERYPDGLPVGEAVATTAGELPARWVIHTVGPIYRRERDPASLLARSVEAGRRDLPLRQPQRARDDDAAGARVRGAQRRGGHGGVGGRRSPVRSPRRLSRPRSLSRYARHRR